MEYRIRLLKKSDNRRNFESSSADLDYFFKRYAAQNQFRHHIGVTYVATNENDILGYVTIAMGSIEAEKFPAKAPPGNYRLPVLRVGRLAVDTHFMGRGVGKQLLRHAFTIALEQKRSVGCVGVVVDAKPEAIEFYRKYGFKPIENIVEGELRGTPSPQPMFLPIKSIVNS